MKEKGGLSMPEQKITAVIIAKNEESMIANCIDTVRWCTTVLVIDNGSEDRTAQLAERQGATVVSAQGLGLAELRNLGLQQVKTPWVLYIDADERVTPALKKEIQQAISSVGSHSAYRIPRNNIHYGKWMQHGGWQHDKLVRLFHTQTIKQWEGDVHEHAEIEGSTADLHEPLVHLTHRNMIDGLKKSYEWTEIEALLLFNAHHPQMSALRLLKVVIWDFLYRMVALKAYRDGTPGVIEAMVQSMNRFMVYERLWELQQNPSLRETYEKIEKDIVRVWQKENA